MGDLPTPIPPQDLEAEQAVLGSMLLERQAIEACRALLGPEHFYTTPHVTICRAIYAMHDAGEDVDALLLSSRLRDAGALDDCGGMAYLVSLLESPATALLAPQYAKVVRDKATLRAMLTAADQLRTLAHAGSHNTSAAVAEAQALVAAIAERNGDASGDFGLPIEQFLSQEFSKTGWLLDRYIPAGGLTIVAGDAKSGKSMFCWTLAICCAAGQDFLGQISVPTTGPVIIIDEESPASRLQRRLRRMAAELCEGNDTPSMPISLRLNSHWRLHKPQDLASLRSAVRKSGAKFVLIDSLHAVSQASGKDFYRADDARELTQPLLDLAHDEDCTVVVIHHLKKPGVNKEANRHIYRLMDSVDFTASADSVLAIEKVADSGGRRVMSLASRWDSEEACPDFIFGILDTQELRRGDPGLVLTWGDFVDASRRPRTAKDQAREDIVAALADGAWLAARELVACAMASGSKERTVKRTLSAMVEEKAIERRGEAGGLVEYRHPGAAGSTDQAVQEAFGDDEFKGPFDAE